MWLKCLMCSCMVLGVFAACDDSQPVESNPVATSVVPERAEQEEPPLLPGAGLAPTFEKSTPHTVPAWRWMYDADSDSNTGLAQDVAYIARYTRDERECGFFARKGGVWCSFGQNSGPGKMRWEVRFEADPFVGAGQMIVHDDTLFVSHHSFIATGAKLSAYHAISGKRIWSVNLEGIGNTGHSKYRNETYLEFDEETNSVLVFGKETHGGYVERRDAAHGTLLASTRIDGWIVNQQKDELSPELKAANGRYKEYTTHKKGGEVKKRVIFEEDGHVIAMHIWPK